MGIERHRKLIKSFVEGRIQAQEFEIRYLALFKESGAGMSESDFVVLNRLFTDVDTYCGDPLLRDEDELSNDDLLASAIYALKSLA